MNSGVYACFMGYMCVDHGLCAHGSWGVCTHHGHVYIGHGVCVNGSWDSVPMDHRVHVHMHHGHVCTNKGVHVCMHQSPYVYG